MSTHMKGAFRNKKASLGDESKTVAHPNFGVAMIKKNSNKSNENQENKNDSKRET